MKIVIVKCRLYENPFIHITIRAVGIYGLILFQPWSYSDYISSFRNDAEVNNWGFAWLFFNELYFHLFASIPSLFICLAFTICNNEYDIFHLLKNCIEWIIAVVVVKSWYKFCRHLKLMLRSLSI